MNLKKTAVLVAIFLFSAAALSGEQIHYKVAIEVLGFGDDGETRIVLDSDDLGFNLHDLQLGENRSIVDKEGRTILITRTEEGFTFDVDGKTISMPAFDSLDGEQVWINKGDHSSDLDGVMIFSGEEIDAATQQIIRSALESTGHSNVRFVGGDEGGQRHVRIIKKVVETDK